RTRFMRSSYRKGHGAFQRHSEARIRCRSRQTSEVLDLPSEVCRLRLPRQNQIPFTRAYLLGENRPMHPSLTIFCLLLLSLPLAAAELGPMPREVRFDRFGDPLPDGALARLGTTRHRHPQATHLAFSADGSRFVTWGRDDRLRFWTTRSGECFDVR